MSVSNKKYIKERNIGRREEDNRLRDQLRRHKQLFHVGQIITSEMDMEALFVVIMDQTNRIMGTERSTVFLHDSGKNELWSLVATGMERNEIRIPADSGVAGWVFQSETTLIINDPYNDPRFYPEVDRRTGFRTRNIICVPVINRRRQCIGALQAINKDGGDFTDEDKALLVSISHYVAIALENSRLYSDVKSYLDKLKATLTHIETLEKIRSQLTKFVPSWVAKSLEQAQGRPVLDKVPTGVAVLFIDIEGFSRITEGFDQRLVNDMVETHFSRYLNCIHNHGGEVTETSGDGLMVLFKDASLESNAREAVKAALDICTENKRLNDELAYPWGRTDLHLGIESGQAWVGCTKMKGLSGERWTYTASGMVTVLAARIGKLSHQSRVCVGPEAHRCIQSCCDSSRLGTHSLRKAKDPIPIYWIKDISDGGENETAELDAGRPLSPGTNPS